MRHIANRIDSPGLMALPRSPLNGGEVEQTKEVEEIMDAASLPPS